VRDHFLAAVTLAPGLVVSGYWPQPEELDCRPLLLTLHRAGHPVGLPVIARRGEPLAFRLWQPERPLIAGTYGIAVPPDDAPVVVPALVLAPLLAFDAAGYRLGYGGGFYDRTLEKLAAGGNVVAVGVAYAAQEVPAVPRRPARPAPRLDHHGTGGLAGRLTRSGECGCLFLRRRRRARGPRRGGRARCRGCAASSRSTSSSSTARTPPAASASPSRSAPTSTRPAPTSSPPATMPGTRRETSRFIGRDPRLLRPHNFPPGTPGPRLGRLCRADGGRKVLVVNAMGRSSWTRSTIPSPRSSATSRRTGWAHGDAPIIVDVHAEATSEKMALGHLLDGRVSLVVGTHTHVPTADHQILPGGTAYLRAMPACAATMIR
jgi:5-formyltetrahydrofolate cyclo-ligase